MVVLWCDKCGALMGVKEPIHDWRREQGVCPSCIAKISAEIPLDVKQEMEKASPPEPPAEGT